MIATRTATRTLHGERVAAPARRAEASRGLTWDPENSARGPDRWPARPHPVGLARRERAWALCAALGHSLLRAIGAGDGGNHARAHDATLR